jgi:hypothetical protein
VGLLDLQPQARLQQAPACAPAPQMGCSQWQYACGAFRVSQPLYAALQAQESCAADLDTSGCIAGRHEAYLTQQSMLLQQDLQH